MIIFQIYKNNLLFEMPDARLCKKLIVILELTMLQFMTKMEIIG